MRNFDDLAIRQATYEDVMGEDPMGRHYGYNT